MVGFKTESFKLEGFAEMYRCIEHLPLAVRRKELEPLMIESLTPMRDTARRIAPDDPLTGPPWNLPTSIEVSWRQRTGASSKDRALGRFDARAYMGPTRFGYPQAIFQEFGTIRHVASPYMRPAWDTEKHKALEIIRSGMATRVEMIVRKYGPA
jgi:hypothetical protein